MTDILSSDSPLRGLTPRQARLYWADELESGKWKQGKNRLKHAGRHCCLGVALELVGVEFRQDGAWLPDNTWVDQRSLPSVAHRQIFGLDDDTVYVLAAANDRGKTFAEIAAALRKEPSQIEKALK